MKPVTRSGVWGRPEMLPKNVKHALDELPLETDWQMLCGDDGAMWLVARLYEESNFGQLVAARVAHEQDWGTP